MPGSVQFREMQAADLADACRLWSESEGVELAEGDGVEELARYLVRNPGTSYVAIAGTRVVGAVLGGHDGRRGFLYHLAVEPSHRGQRIGRELVRRAVEALKRAGLRRVLILVARDNHPGRQFWIGEGWEPLAFAEPMGLDL